MMSVRAASSSSVRRVGGGFASSANIVSKDDNTTMIDNAVNAADIPVGDGDSGPLTNLFNDSEAVDLDVPDGMRVATALARGMQTTTTTQSGGMSKAALTKAGGKGEVISAKSSASTGARQRSPSARAPDKNDTI